MAAQAAGGEKDEMHHRKVCGSRVARDCDHPDGRHYGRAGRGAIRDGIRPADADGSGPPRNGCQYLPVRRRNELDAVDYDNAHRPDDVGNEADDHDGRRSEHRGQQHRVLVSDIGELEHEQSPVHRERRLDRHRWRPAPDQHGLIPTGVPGVDRGLPGHLVFARPVVGRQSPNLLPFSLFPSDFLLRSRRGMFSIPNINHDTFKSASPPWNEWRRKPQEDRTMKSIIRKDEAAVSPVIATILMVAITVVLAAVLYVMVSGLLTPTGQGPRVMGVNIGRSGDGTNWTLLITTTPTGLTTSAVKLTITTGGGANTVVNNIAFSSLTSANWNANKAQFIGSGGSTVIVGDRVVVSTTSYPPGYQVLIADSQGILYSHALS